MSVGLNNLILNINKIHKTLLHKEKIHNLDYVIDFIKDYNYEVKEQYLSILLKYYFQNNQVKNLKELSSLGYKFELTMDDIKSAFLNITSDEENVIQVYQSDIVFLKDRNYSIPLKIIYDCYQNSDDEKKMLLDKTIDLLKKNQYICAYSYKNKNLDFGKFFLDDELVTLLKEELPFLLK